jgi:nucleotide-binding universal stress UspA family protein
MTHTNVLDDRAIGAVPEPTSGPVLVALKPFDAGESAIAMARWLADRRHAELHAMSVMEMGDLGTSVAGLPPLAPEYYQRERDEIAEDLRARVSRPTESERVRIDVVDGPPGSAVAHIAASRRASTIVIGTGRHGVLGRFLYGERALDVVRNAEGPVLVVPPDAEPPIERVVVALDFSQASVRAATAALEMVGPDGHLTLVHVAKTARHQNGQQTGAEEEDARRISALLARVADQMPQSSGVRLDTAILRGDAVGALLRFVEENQVDLVACGRRRHSLIERLLVGSVSTGLIRSAPCCVLVTPEFPQDEEADARLVFGEVQACVKPDEWRALLQELRARNTGRRAQLSLAAGSTDGVASTDRGYVLLALEYDRRGDRVEIVLGDPHVMGSQLTHRITGIKRIETVTEPDGGNARVEFDSRSGRCILDFIGA